jgi:hypothetical protein
MRVVGRPSQYQPDSPEAQEPYNFARQTRWHRATKSQCPSYVRVYKHARNALLLLPSMNLPPCPGTIF